MRLLQSDVVRVDGEIVVDNVAEVDEENVKSSKSLRMDHAKQAAASVSESA